MTINYVKISTKIEDARNIAENCFGDECTSAQVALTTAIRTNTTGLLRTELERLKENAEHLSEAITDALTALDDDS